MRRASAYAPAIAVLDLNSPAAPGYDDAGLRILQYLRSHFPTCSILGMTSEIFPDKKKKYLSLGVDELLDKPFDTQQLLDFLRRLAPLRSLDGIESGSFTLRY